jgi:hypothetical protein
MNFIKQQLIITSWNELLNIISSTSKIESYCEIGDYALVYSNNYLTFYINDYHKNIIDNDLIVYKFIPFDDLSNDEKEKYKLKLDNNGNYYYSKQNYYNKVYNDLHSMDILDVLKEV